MINKYIVIGITYFQSFSGAHVPSSYSYVCLVTNKPTPKQNKIIKKAENQYDELISIEVKEEQ